MKNALVHRYRKIILDCNVWITDFLRRDSKLRAKISKNNYQVILSSYMALELLRVLKRLSVKISTTFTDLESKFWNVCNFSFVHLDFNKPFMESLLIEVKHSPEFRVIAQLLELETKDVPYIVSAFQHKAILISNDIRSIIEKRDLICKKLNVTILTVDEFLQIE